MANDDFRLLSLPDGPLEAIISRIDHPLDRHSVALTCSRLHRLQRSVSQAVVLWFISTNRNITPRIWLRELGVYSGVFSSITNLVVYLTNHGKSSWHDKLLVEIGAGCPRLESLKLVWDSDHEPPNGVGVWRTFARHCPLLTSLDLVHWSPSFNELMPLPPVHTLRSLQALTLSFPHTDIAPLLRCSSLTSLTLWNPTSSTLSSLASSSSALRLSLQSLSIDGVDFCQSLSCLSSFTRLSSLSLLSCIFKDSHSLACSLHTLTHITLHNCPFVSSHELAALVQSNPSLSSLTLSSYSYRFFAPRGFSNMLELCCSRLHTLELCGVPSFRPGLLAHCSSLRNLTVKGRCASLEGLCGMLVRAEEVEVRDGEGVKGGRREREDVGGGEDVVEGRQVEEEGRQEERERLPSSAVAVAGGGRSDEREFYVDMRSAAIAAHAEASSAADDAVDWLFHAQRNIRVLFPRARLDVSIERIREAALFCQITSRAIRCADAAMEREKAMMGVFKGLKASGFLSEVLAAAGALDNFRKFDLEPSSDFPADGAEWEDGERSVEHGVGARADMALLMDELRVRAESLFDIDRDFAFLWSAEDEVGEGGEEETPGRGEGEDEPQGAEGWQGEGEDETQGAGDRQGEGEDQSQGENSAIQPATSVDVICPCLESLTLKDLSFSPFIPPWLPAGLFVASPPLRIAPSTTASPLHRPSSSHPSQQQHPFESIVLEAVFGRLKRLVLSSVQHLEEERLIALLGACHALNELRVDDSEDFSDRVLLSTTLHMLTDVTLERCSGITADGIARCWEISQGCDTWRWKRGRLPPGLGGCCSALVWW